MTKLYFASSCAVILLLAPACDDLDGGLVKVTKLPPAVIPDASPDTSVQPAVTITSPADGATVDADWVLVTLDIDGFALDATHSVAVTIITGQAEPVTKVIQSAETALVRAPAGAFTIRATLVEGTSPLAVFDEVSVTGTITSPAISITTPADGALVPSTSSSLAVEVAVTNFTLLADGATPTGPRQGRLSLTLDDESGLPIGTSTTTLALPAEGAHTLTAALVDEAGLPWRGDASLSDSVAFAVAPPTAVVITAPIADSVVKGARLTVSIETTGFVTDGAATPGHGTFAVTLDGAAIATKRTGAEVLLNGLAAGAHTLQVELTTADGAPLAPPVTDNVSFSSELLPPGIDLVLPSGTSVKAGTQRVAVVPHNFTFTGLPIPGPLVPATGAWQVLVDDTVVQAVVRTAQTTVQLTPGTHKLTARLIDTSGAALTPEVSATRTLDVRALETSVEILSPRPGTPVPKRFPVAIAFEDFTLTDALLGPTDPVVPGVGHFHVFTRKVGASSFDYRGFFLTETFEIEVPEPGMWEMKVALHYQNHEPVLPAVEANVTFEVDGTSGVRIMSPLPNARIGAAPFAVAVQVDNFELIPLGEVSTVRGHYHLFVDGNYQGFFLTPRAVLDPAALDPVLTPGSHTLTAFLHNSNHEPILGTLSDAVDFVYDPKPAVRIVSPAPDAVVGTDPFTVTVAVDNLAIVDKAGQAPAAGEGHVHVFVDSEYVDFKTASSFPLAIAAPGEHTIKVTLHQNDHSPIDGAAPAFVKVLVDPTPRVDIIAPGDGTFTYGGDFDVMLAPHNHAGHVDVSVDGELVFSGAPADVVFEPLLEGRHTLTVTPVTSEGEVIPNALTTDVSFEVVGIAPPTLTWVSPIANASVVAGQSVTLGVTDFSLEAGLGRRPAVPGDGLWTLSAAGRVYGPYAAPTVALPALPRGSQTLVAELWHRDGSRVVPRRTAAVEVVVGGASPGLSIASPGPGDLYGPSFELAVDVSAFALGPASGWVSVKVDGYQAALEARDRFAIGGFAPGLHVLEVELVDAAQAPLQPAVKTSTFFRIGGAAVPSVTITSPADDATLAGGGAAVAFTVDGPVLDPVAAGGRAQPGRGAVLVRVDGRVVAIAASSPVTVSGLSPGRHTIRLELAGLDLVPVQPSVVDEVDVVVP